MKFTVVFILILIFGNQNFSQSKKGDKLFDKKLYLDAINAYEKSIKKEENSHSYIQLGKLYKITKEYHKSSDAFAKAITFNDVSPKVYLEYGMSLLAINQPIEAQNNFEVYASKMNGDPRADLLILGCEQLIEWNKDTLGWEITSLEGINTPASEFGPHPYLNGLIYCSTGKTNR